MQNFQLGLQTKSLVLTTDARSARMSVTTAFQSMNGGDLQVIVGPDVQSGGNTSTLKVVVRDSASRKFNLTIWFAFAQPQSGPGYGFPPVSRMDIRQMGSVTMESADGERGGAAAAFPALEQLYVEHFRAGNLDGVFSCIDLLANSDLRHFGALFDHRLVKAFIRLRGTRPLQVGKTPGALRTTLVADFIAEQRRQAPAYYLARFLSDGEMERAAMLFALIPLVSPARVDIRMETLEGLIKEVMTKRRLVDVSRVEKEVKKVFVPAKKSWIEIVSAKTELDDFVNGRVGELTGLFGELRTLAGLRREIVKRGSKVKMGVHIPVSGKKSPPEVDLYFVTIDGKEVLVENAATIQKLRDKLRNNAEAGAQRANYERLLMARPDGAVLLAYSASVPKWFDLFIPSGRSDLPPGFVGPECSVACRVSKLDRALLVDGILMPPEDLKNAWKRLQAILAKTGLTYRALNGRIWDKRISAAFLFGAPLSKVLKHLAWRPIPGRRLSTQAVAGSQCDLDDLSDQPPMERVEAHFLRKDNPFAVLADL